MTALLALATLTVFSGCACGGNAPDSMRMYFMFQSDLHTDSLMPSVMDQRMFPTTPYA